MAKRCALVLGAIAIALGGLAGAACGDDDEPSSEEAQEALCDDLGGLEQAFAGLGDVGLDSSVNDFRDVRDEIRDSLDEVRDSAPDSVDAEVDELEAAFDDLATTIDGFGEDTSIAEAIEAISDDLGGVGAAFAGLGERVTCE